MPHGYDRRGRMTGRLKDRELTMRKVMILTTVVVGIGGLVAAAHAGQDRVPEKDSSQVTIQTESLRKEGEHLGTPRDERSREARERYREERREVDEEDDRD